MPDDEGPGSWTMTAEDWTPELEAVIRERATTAIRDEPLALELGHLVIASGMLESTLFQSVVMLSKIDGRIARVLMSKTGAEQTGDLLKYLLRLPFAPPVEGEWFCTWWQETSELLAQRNRAFHGSWAYDLGSGQSTASKLTKVGVSMDLFPGGAAELADLAHRFDVQSALLRFRAGIWVCLDWPAGV